MYPAMVATTDQPRQMPQVERLLIPMNGQIDATSSTISNLAVGSYSVTISDANAMSSDATVNISQPALLGLATVA